MVADFDLFKEKSSDSEIFEDYEIEETPQEKLKELTDEWKPKAGNFLKLYGKNAVIGLAVLIALFLVLDFFVLSVSAVAFSIENTEGSIISDISGKVLDSSGNEIYRFATGIFSIPLQEGSYTLVIERADYSPGPFGFSVSRGEKEKIFSVEKNYDLGFADFSFPASLSVGAEESNLEIGRIVNNSSQEINLVMVTENFDSKVFEHIEAVPNERFPLAPGASVGVKLNYALNSRFDFPSGKEEDGIKTSFVVRPKFLSKSNNASKRIEFILYPLADVRITSPIKEVNFSRIDGGKTTYKEIKIENKDAFSSPEVILDVAITYANSNDKEEVRSWFSWGKCTSSSVCNFGELNGKEKLTAKLYVNVPLDAKTDDIQGQVRMKYGPKEYLPLPLKISVSEIEAELSVKPIKDDFVVRKDGEAYVSKRYNLIVENKGDIELTGIELKVEGCEETWFYIPYKKEFPEKFPLTLIPGEQINVGMVIGAPSSSQTGQSKTCNLNYVYSYIGSDGEVSKNIAIFISPA